MTPSASGSRRRVQKCYAVILVGLVKPLSQVKVGVLLLYAGSALYNSLLLTLADFFATLYMMNILHVL